MHHSQFIVLPHGGTELDQQDRELLQQTFITGRTDDVREIRVEGHFDGCEGMDDGDPVDVSTRRAQRAAEVLREIGWERAISIVAYGSDYPRSRCPRHGLDHPINPRIEFSVRVCRP